MVAGQAICARSQLGAGIDRPPGPRQRRSMSPCVITPCTMTDRSIYNDGRSALVPQQVQRRPGFKAAAMCSRCAHRRRSCGSSSGRCCRRLLGCPACRPLAGTTHLGSSRPGEGRAGRQRGRRGVEGLSHAGWKGKPPALPVLLSTHMTYSNDQGMVICSLETPIQCLWMVIIDRGAN